MSVSKNTFTAYSMCTNEVSGRWCFQIVSVCLSVPGGPMQKQIKDSTQDEPFTLQGAPTYDFSKFSKNCMKLRTFWAIFGCVPGAPPRSANAVWLIPGPVQSRSLGDHPSLTIRMGTSRTCALGPHHTGTLRGPDGKRSVGLWLKGLFVSPICFC